MEVKTIDSFLSYYERTREITNRVIQVIPQDKLDWTYMPGKFSLADLVRHLAAIERYVFAEVAKGNHPCYKGCGKFLADGYDNIMTYYNEMHLQSIEIFKSINDEDLTKKIKVLDGREIEIGNFLRALIVHEIHHRGAMCIYLNLLNIETPSIIGLKEEQVIELSK
ncbi:MAG: DinB family protein [Bacteroidia bacterium]